MEYIKAIRDKKALEGTCYFEFYLGEFKGEFWGEGNLFISMAGFDLILNIFKKHISDFNYFGETRINAIIWKRIYEELKNILNKIKSSENYNDLDKILNVHEYYKTSCINQFEEVKSLIYEMIKEIILCSEENIDKYSTFFVLGL